MERTNRKARTETPEEAADRERWMLRLKEIQPPDPADEGVVARFMKALEEYRAEKVVEDAREERLRQARNIDGKRTGFTRAGDLIPAEYLPKGDAYEDPEPAEDIPPPPEV